MKKVISLVLAMLMVGALGWSALAEPTDFTKSPTADKLPNIQDYENEDPDCTAILILTRYDDRNNLPEEDRVNFEQAYEQIRNVGNLIQVCEGLIPEIEKQGIAKEDIAASDIFHIDYSDCEIHDDHGEFTITMAAAALKNFVGLMHEVDGKWELVPGATVSKDGTALPFRTDRLGNFALAVKKTAKPEAESNPKTGQDAGSAGWVALFTLSSTAAVLIWRKKETA